MLDRMVDDSTDVPPLSHVNAAQSSVDVTSLCRITRQLTVHSPSGLRRGKGVNKNENKPYRVHAQVVTQAVRKECYTGPSLQNIFLIALKYT
jgi:hypothetical protein